MNTLFPHTRKELQRYGAILRSVDNNEPVALRIYQWFAPRFNKRINVKKHQSYPCLDNMTSVNNTTVIHHD